MMNMLIKEAAKSLASAVVGNDGYIGSTLTDKALETLTRYMIDKSDDFIDYVIDFLQSHIQHHSLSHITHKGCYLYHSRYVITDTMEYTHVSVLNLNTLNVFEGNIDKHALGTAEFWGMIYPNIAKILKDIEDKYEGDKFVLYEDILQYSTWTDFGSPAVYSININTGHVEYDYIED